MMDQPQPLITIVGKDECYECGGKLVALKVGLQISRLDTQGNPTKWDPLGKPLEQYKYCPTCRNMVPTTLNEVAVPELPRKRNPFGFL